MDVVFYAFVFVFSIRIRFQRNEKINKVTNERTVCDDVHIIPTQHIVRRFEHVQMGMHSTQSDNSQARAVCGKLFA